MNTLDTYAAAQELKTELAGVVDTTAVVVDLDPALINSALAAGRVAVHVMPPRVTYPTAFSAEATWTVVLVVPVIDLVRAWAELDKGLAQLGEAIDVDTVTPSQYQTAKGTLYPAFSIEFTQPYDL